MVLFPSLTAAIDIVGHGGGDAIVIVDLAMVVDVQVDCHKA